MPLSPAPEPPPAPNGQATVEQLEGCGRGRLAAAEAAVVIAVIGAVTVLTVAQRPLPGVLVALCAASSAVLVRLPAGRLLGCCGGGQE
jgi:hypothetical protein